MAIVVSDATFINKITIIIDDSILKMPLSDSDAPPHCGITLSLMIIIYNRSAGHCSITTEKKFYSTGRWTFFIVDLSSSFFLTETRNPDRLDMPILCSSSLKEIKNSSLCHITLLVTVKHRNRSSRRRMHLCMQDDQNGQKMMVLTSAEESRLTCFILLQNIFFWSNQPSLTADVNTIINLPWYPRKIVHFSFSF